MLQRASGNLGLMKISGPGATTSAAGPRGAKAAGGDGFRLPSMGGASAPTQAGGVSAMGGVMALDALLALQDVGGPLERRKRAVRRGGRILDALDDIKLGLLAGELSKADLHRLQQAVSEAREGVDDPVLEAVLQEIEVRAAVEGAKLEGAGAAG